ncbi:UpxY family transcription antiterminator [Ascidiimonas sp. W6]|uniref:UpxY family transcription antiterminator n=1 Tax=Ascidiimonas meishanensis TaxID=3128903 RepID=UPI0030EB59E3
MKSFKKGWYVLYVKSRMEKRVDKSLQEKEIQSFLPLLKSVHQWSDRKKVVFEPLFKSYVFAYLNTQKDFYVAQNDSGVCTFLSFNNEYVRARNEEIDQIRLLTDCNNIYNIKTANQYFVPGDRCVVSDGSLKGLRCEVVRVNNERKVLVRLNSIGQNILATLPPDQLDTIKVPVSSSKSLSI